jgi:hypothetical protein
MLDPSLTEPGASQAIVAVAVLANCMACAERAAVVAEEMVITLVVLLTLRTVQPWAIPAP